MKITERQTEILNRLIQEYIDSARPVSSQLLEKKYDFGICPAMIRIEMQKLTEGGYLYQPHTSAGRVPTDKGYRFFVNQLLEKELEEFDIGDWFKDFGNTIKLLQSLTKKLASFSQNLALGYLKKEKILWKEGWEEILKQPEFEGKDYFISFTEFLEDFEENIEDFKINSGIKIFIGRENPFKKAKNFSIISTKCCLPKGEEGILSLLGPKRMAYEKNIGLINSLMKVLEKD
jgi:transcriptional regulator of heat shock response